MTPDPQKWAQTSLARILPRVRASLGSLVPTMDPQEWDTFAARLDRHFPRLFSLMLRLYGNHYDFFYHLEQTVLMAARMWAERPASLKGLDAERERDPWWFRHQRMVGGVLYVDLFAGDLGGVREKIPYLKEMGVTYLHLMPLFLSPEGNNDGGYAVSSYRHVDSSLGTMDDLSELAGELRREGISLVLDFVFNHTSNEHEWARRALAGEEEYRNYYFIFPDRTMPDAYGRTLRDIFPTQRPGSFTFVRMDDSSEGRKQKAEGSNSNSQYAIRIPQSVWVWTTFYSFQWDLNYSNPAVFTAMGEEMLSLANRGAEILRLDALAFVWKRLGTSCENLPEAHLLIQAFNALARIAAPALLFKSEAIVHPDEVLKYISEDECQISYNPLLMALLWEALATGEVRLLALSMRKRSRIGECCAWANYVRSHDDIGWTFDDGDAARLGINPYSHRQYLNAFYIGRIERSFASGLPFQENPQTGDARVSGTLASLAGLEKAVASGDKAQIDMAINRILLMHSVILSIGGIPLLYMGDEVGTLNDYSYLDDPSKADDSRWVHRPYTDWEKIAQRDDPGTLEGRIYGELMRLVTLRKGTPAFAGGNAEIIETENRHVFGYRRRHGAERVVVLANFSAHDQRVPAYVLSSANGWRDLVSGDEWRDGGNLVLEPYRFVWLEQSVA